MADFLIKNTSNWMDELTEAQIAERVLEEPSFQETYDARYQKGDVLEVAENNRWHDGQHGNGKFLIVRIPFLKIEQVLEYIKPLKADTGEVDGDGIPIMKTLNRRRYRLWFETLSEEDMKAYEIAPFVYQVNTLEDLQLFGQDKFDEV